jgi:leader peptidase (prepilin peptidase) / N-methyltransferase
MLPQIFFSVAVFLTGIAMGSFANVVIYRVPRGLSIVKPRSFCPGCSTPISSFDNLPLVSWLVLRGRCRHCGCPISPRYFLVELAAGVMYVAVFAHFGFGWDAFLIPYLFLVTVTLMVGVIDIEQQIIPNVIILPALLAGLAAAGVIALARGDWGILAEQVAGMLIGGVPLGLVALLIPRGMGMGDAKLMAFVGVILGWKVIPAIFLGFLTGVLWVIVPLVTGKKGLKDRIPFGPFLVLGSWISIFAGGWIVELYRTTLHG